MSRRDFSVSDIHLALDGELPADERADFDAWLESSPEMAALNARYATDRDNLAGAFAGIVGEPVPQAMLERLAGPSLPSPRRVQWWRAAVAALLLVAGGAVGYALGLTGIGFRPDPGFRLADSAIVAHEIYSNENRHAVEVSASEKDHLQSWLSNRIGLTLVVPDLTGEGFELLGGRLLPLGEGTAALLLYQNEKNERISIYVTGESTTKSKGRYEEADGSTAIYWLDKGYGCAIVGTLSHDSMSAVARDAWRQLLSGLKA